MKAMVLWHICDLTDNQSPLKMEEIPVPLPKEGEILFKVLCCGVCHTELDEIEGRTPPSSLPMILGHQIVARVESLGPGAVRYKKGDRVGIGWIYSSCGRCDHCKNGKDNLCQEFKATGRDENGGYAEYGVIPERFAFPIPDIFSDSQAAPLLCAGAIGYRSLRLSRIKNGQDLGLTGFGASAHLVLKMVRYKFPDTSVYVFARNKKEREFALELGAVWAGTAEENSPKPLDSIIDTTPAWKPVVEGMKNLKSGGRMVINAIRKEETDKHFLLSIDYPSHLWMEKEIKSVANVARGDIMEFLDLASMIPIIPEFQEFTLYEANKALLELKQGGIRGAKVLRIGS